MTTKPTPQPQNASPQNGPPLPAMDSAGRRSAFMAWLLGDESAKEAETTPAASAAGSPAAAPHPVLVAALAAGLDTPEKLQAVLDERMARQEADAASATLALTTARNTAQSAAVAAFGQGTPLLAEAQNAIAQQESLSALAAMTSAFKAARPAQQRPGAARQTQGNGAQSDDNGTGTGTTGEAAANQTLSPGNVYKSRRGRK